MVVPVGTADADEGVGGALLASATPGALRPATATLTATTPKPVRKGLR